MTVLEDPIDAVRHCSHAVGRVSLWRPDTHLAVRYVSLGTAFCRPCWGQNWGISKEPTTLILPGSHIAVQVKRPTYPLRRPMLIDSVRHTARLAATQGSIRLYPHHDCSAVHSRRVRAVQVQPFLVQNCIEILVPPLTLKPHVLVKMPFTA
jgi:hypothetical protein